MAQNQNVQAYEALIRLVMEISVDTAYKEKYASYLMKYFGKYNIVMYKAASYEEEPILVSGSALEALLGYDSALKKTVKIKEGNYTKNICGCYLDPIEIKKKYSSKGVDVILDGIIPIVGTKDEIEFIKRSKLDDPTPILEEILSQTPRHPYL